MVAESLMKAPNTSHAPTISSSYHQVRFNDILLSIVKIVLFCFVFFLSFFFCSEYYCSPHHNPAFGAALVVLLTFIRCNQLSFGDYG